MRSLSLRVLLIGFISIFLAGCAAQQLPTTDYKPYQFAEGTYVQKVDHFIVILDASSSMKDLDGKLTNIQVAKDVVFRMNRTIPSDLKLTAGLRTFGQNICPVKPKTKMAYGPTRYSKALFEEALIPIEAKGLSPMASALNAAKDDFRAKQGPLALIVVSDGREDHLNYAEALAAAKRLNSAYGDRLCLYTILVGKDKSGQSLMEKLAKTSACGGFVKATDLASPQDMAAFVKRVFLAAPPKKEVKPAPAPPKAPKPQDSDYDGVIDDRDYCPKTPVGAKVDEKGCWRLGDIYFDTDTSKVKPQYFTLLDEVLSVMKKNPELKLVLKGHTDSRGTAAYNKALSERRAKTVRDYLVEKGIDQDRLCPIGYGLTMPKSSNLAEEGRALNRRVELHPTWK